MNVIFEPSGTGSGRSSCLPHRHLLLILLIGGLVLPVFLGVLAGPLVRSSYRAGRLWAKSMLSKGLDIPPHLAHLAEDIALEGQGTFAQAV